MFPRQRAFSASGGRAAAATGAAGGFYVSLCLIVQTAVQKLVEKKLLFFYGFRRDVRQFLGSILAPFRPSGPLCFPVRQRAFSAPSGPLCFLSGSVRFQLREEEQQQQQQEQQEGSMSHYVSLYKQRYKKLLTTIVFLGFQKGR